jgi:hypothetical protein
MPGRRAEGLADAKAVADATDPEPPVADATDPERHLSPTPPTPLGDVDGAVDRPGNLSLT